MSFHKPDMFADKMWLSYGRILPFAKTAFLYGFVFPLAMALHCGCCPLGRTTLACDIASTFAAKLCISACSLARLASFAARAPVTKVLRFRNTPEHLFAASLMLGLLV